MSAKELLTRIFGKPFKTNRQRNQRNIFQSLENTSQSNYSFGKSQKSNSEKFVSRQFLTQRKRETNPNYQSEDILESRTSKLSSYSDECSIELVIDDERSLEEKDYSTPKPKVSKLLAEDKKLVWHREDSFCSNDEEEYNDY